MAKNASQRRKKPNQSDQAGGQQAGSTAAPRAAGVLHWIGALALLVAIGALGVLVYAHLTGLSAPGCGPGSGCDLAASSVWGKVPVVNWPISAVGLAYFVSVLVMWLRSGDGLGQGLRWMVRLGALFTVFYLGVIVVGKYNCKYCLTAHIANLVFCVIAECRPRAAAARLMPQLAGLAGTFALCTIALAGVSLWKHREADASRAIDLEQSTQEIVEQSVQRATGQAPPTSADTGPIHMPSGGFTGRWRIGPENAPIRLVIFSDYQCPDCQDIERQVEALLAQRSDLSVSHKHFPMCTDCNVYMGRANMHRNACWAARAAEAAGIVGGNDAFWKMHHWLFEVKGYFETNADLERGLQRVGFALEQRKRFYEVLNSEQSLEPVKADIEEAHMLGLHFTPMIFINGVELRGFVKNPVALSNAIQRLAATNPPPGSPLDDRPPLAIDKCVGDWKAQPRRKLPEITPYWPLGPADAKVQIQVWADFQFKNIVELDQVIRELMAKRGDIQYIVRPFPISNECNPFSRVQRESPACLIALANIAASQLGGADAYWKLMEWILNNQSSLNEQSLRKAAPQLGLDPDQFIAAIHSPQTQALLRQQLDAIGPHVPQGVPTIYVNGKWVARWKFDEEVVLDEIVEEAAK